MLREALDRLIELARNPKEGLTQIHGLQYLITEHYNGTNHTVLSPPMPSTLSTTTLDGLLEWFESPEGPEEGSGGHFIHIHSPEVVCLLKERDAYQQRETVMRARFEEDGFAYGRWHLPEDFIINAQTKIMEGPAKAALIEMVSKVRGDEVKTSEDNGIGQVVTVVNKVGRLEDKETTPMVELAPRRTFAECQQPSSPFLLRMRHVEGVTEVALFEADCGAWKVAAVEGIAAYLRDHPIVRARGISVVG